MAVGHALRGLFIDPNRRHVQEQVVNRLEQVSWEIYVLALDQALQVLVHLDAELLDQLPAVIIHHLRRIKIVEAMHDGQVCLCESDA